MYVRLLAARNSNNWSYNLKLIFLYVLKDCWILAIWIFFPSIGRYFWMAPEDFWLHILLYLFTFVLNDRLRSSSPSISKITQEILREDSRHYELSTCSEKKIHTIIANSSPLKFQYTYSHNTVMAIGPKSLWSRIANFIFTVVISKDLFSELVFESVDNQKLNCDFKMTLASLRPYLKCAKTHKVC